MRKTYIFLLTIVAAFSAKAQVTPINHSTDLFLPGSNVADVVPEITPSSAAAAGDTIWYDDFSDFSNWITGVESLSTVDSLWQHTTTGPAGNLTSGLGDIQSATVANGWAIFDAELNGSLTATGGAAPGVTFDSYLQLANPIDLSSYPSVAVTFTEYYYELNSSAFLEVSTDGTSWTTIELHTGLSGNEQTAKNAINYKNISSIAGGESAVWIRLRYSGGGVFWQVDDFMLVEGSTYDLNMLDVFAGDFISSFEYTQIPLAQVTEMSIGAATENAGAAAMPNPIYSYEISNSSGIVADSSFAADTNLLASGVIDTTFFNTGYTPDEVGVYTIAVSVDGDSTDATPSNNGGARDLLVTEFIYAHDDDQNLNLLLDGGTGDNPSPECKFGLLYEIHADAMLYSIQTVFYSQTGLETTSETCTYDVYELLPGDNTPISQLTPIVTGLYDFNLPGDVSTGSSVNIVDILVDEGNGVQLTAGNAYLVAIGNPNEGKNIVLIASGGDRDRAGLRYGPYGQGGAVNWYTGWTTTPLIRLNFDQSVSVQENEDVSDLSLYPNPTHGDLRIVYTSKEDQEMTFNIFDINGSLMLSQQSISSIGQRNTVEFDVSGLASGMYLVQIQGSNSTLTRRFVVN